MPVDASNSSAYGSGYINGTIIGIPKNAKNKDASWAFVKYMTTNDHALAQFSNGIRNVPSTKSSAKSKELKPDPNFNTFTQLFANPKSQTTPITSAGSAYLDTFANFLAKWQSGKVSNLQKGLQEVDKQIDAKLKQSGGGPPGGGERRDRNAGSRGGSRDRPGVPGRCPTAGGPSGGRPGAAAAWSSPS